MNLLEEVVLDILVIEGEILLEDVVRHVKHRLGEAADKDEVHDALLNLQQQQRVSYGYDDRWEAQSTAHPEAQATRANSMFHKDAAAAEVFTPPDAGLQSGSSSPSTSAGKKASKINHEQTRWRDFRRICAYYIDCVRQDDSPSVRAYSERRGERWVALYGTVNWGALESTSQSHKRVIQKSEVDFVKEGKKRGSRQYIGYPCELVKPKDEEKDPFWSPLFLLPVHAKFTLDEVSVRPAGMPILNPTWARFGLKKAEDRRVFCELVGLSVLFDEDEESLVALNSENVPFAEMARRAGQYLQKKCKQPIHPHALTAPATSVEELSRGIYNHALLVNGRKGQYTAGLLRDLEKIRDTPDEYLDRTALAALFPHEPAPLAAAAAPEQVPAEASPVRNAEDPERILNPAQRRATDRALRQPLTVVTGPPGTGKSAVVTAVLLNQALQERPALLASRNHQAIDAVEPRLNALASEKELVIRPRRAGQFFTFKWKDFLKKLLSQPGVDARKQHCAERQALQHSLEILDGRLDDIRAWHAVVDDLAVATDAHEKACLPLPARWDDDVVACFAGGSPSTVARLRDEFDALARPPVGLWKRLLRWLFRRRHRAALQARLDAVREWPRPTADLDWSSDAVAGQREAWQTVWNHWHQLAEAHHTRQQRTDAETTTRAQPALDSLTAHAATERARAGDLTTGLLSRVADSTHILLTQAQRTAFQTLSAKAENFGEKAAQESFRKHLPDFLEVYPIWAITSLSASSSLPLQPGGFDLLVVDEASQSDVASVVPLLFRARRALIVGDPAQLSHVTSLDPRADAALLARHQMLDDRFQRFSYRVNSLYALAASAPELEGGPILLNQHYRCHPSIAGYASTSFYGGALQVWTAGRAWRVPKGQKAGVAWTDVAGGIDSSGGSGATSQPEIDAVTALLVDMAEAGFKGTVGVVTPFKRQATRLRDALEDTLNDDLRHVWALRVGTAHAFQGDERDVIVVSLCCGSDMSPGTRSFVTTKQNLFNVAVTRARAVLHVVGDLSWAREDGPGFIRRLAVLSATSDAPKGPPAYESVWEERLDTALRAAGILTQPQYEVVGRRLDLAVVRPGVKLDIEVDGEAYHRQADGSRKPDDLWRDHQLKGAGWLVKRFWVYQLREDMDGCVAAVKTLLESSDDD